MRSGHALLKQTLILLSIVLFSAFHLNSETTNSHDSSDIKKNIKEINQNIEIIRSSFNGKNDSLKQDILSNLDFSISENYIYGMAWNYFLMGRYYQIRFKNDSARIFYEKAWPLAKKNSLSKLVHTLSVGLGNIYWESGNYSSGIEFLLEAKRYFEKHDALNDKYGLINLIALNYEGLFEYEKAMYHFREALRIADQLGNEAFVGIIYSNMGRLLFKQKDYVQALEFLHKGVKIEETEQFIANAAKSYTTIANAYLEIGSTDSSFKYLNRALKYNLKSNDDVGLTRTYVSFGRYYHKIEQYKKSTDYLHKTVELAERIHLNNELITSYKLLAKNYEKLNQYKTSNHYYILYFELYQKIYDVEKINKITALEHKLKLQTKENEISLLKLNEAKQTKQVLLVTTLATIFIILLLIFFIFYYRKNNNLLKLKNDEIVEQKNNLEQLNEKLILAEQSVDKADEMKTKFLNNITHEIRTPLNGIVGFSSLIAESRLSEEKKKETWGVIRQNSETLINTVEGLLKLSMLASNQMNAKKTPLIIHPFLEQLTMEVQQKNDHILKNKIHFQYIPERSSKNTEINTDPHILRQIILNLLDNAFKFTLKGNVTIEFKTTEDQLKVLITDTGIGIEEEYENAIYKQFTKGINVPNNSAGLGIGLTISTKMAELIDGNISYDSELNKGSIFYLSLPIN